MQIAPKSEKVYEQNCPVCLQLLYLAQLFPGCEHVFCKQCLNTITQQKNQLICPLCRLSGDPKEILPLQRLELKLKKDYPEEYENRKIAYETYLQDMSFNFVYGNTAEKINLGNPNRQHYLWKFFIRSVGGKTQDYIEKVEVKLHPTFTPSVRVIDKAPFTLKAMGWGTFNIPVKIYWKDDKQVTQFTYHLQFEPLTQKQLKRTINKQLEEVVSL